MPVKGGFILPFGVDREHQGLPDGLKHAYGAAATLGARGFDNAQKLPAKLHSDIRRWLKTDEEVDRQVDLLKPVWQSLCLRDRQPHTRCPPWWSAVLVNDVDFRFSGIGK